VVPGLTFGGALALVLAVPSRAVTLAVSRPCVRFISDALSLRWRPVPRRAACGLLATGVSTTPGFAPLTFCGRLSRKPAIAGGARDPWGSS